MTLMRVKIDRDVLESLRSRQFRQRFDCHAAFTTYDGGTIWPFANFGRTQLLPGECNLHGRFPALDQIAEIFLDLYPQGGRFFISKSRSRVFRKESQSAVEVTFLLLDLE